MGVKEEVSKQYMEQLRSIHAIKPQRQAERTAIVVGVNPGPTPNIGSAIADNLAMEPPEDFEEVIRTRFAEPEYASSEYLDGADDNHEFFAKHNQADVLISCCGETRMDWVERLNSGEIRRVVRNNLIAPMMLVNQFVQATLMNPWHKHIVLVGSMAYRAVLNASSVYCASKAGLAHFARCAAWELAPKGYSVYCVHPSNTEGTPMTEETIRGLMQYRGLTRPQAEAYWGASLPMASWLHPEDIAETVRFLVSGKANYQSGAQIELAGGQR